MAAPTDDPKGFREAVEAFRSRIPITDEEFDALLEGEEEFAFTVAGVAQADLVLEVFEAIASAIENGDAFEDFQDAVGDKLYDAWGGENPARLETIFRTNLMSAYNEGRYVAMTEPTVKEARPYWRLEVIDDDRTSDICEDLFDTIRPADDPFWDNHYPPLHHNCRTHVVPLSTEEAEEEGVDTTPAAAEADEGFGGTPDNGDEWEPDLSVYPAEIAGDLAAKIGSR